MNHILVPTDFSACAGYAEDVAISIAQRNGASLIFLHGISTGFDWLKIPKNKENQYPEIKARIGQAENELDIRVRKAKDAGVSAIKSLAFLESYKTVANTTLDHAHDLIVVGSHGLSGFKRFVIGSNTGKILRTAKTPVLVIQKPLPQPLSFKTIAFASGLEPDTHPAFERLLHFAKTMGAEHLHFVEVTTPHNFKPSKQVKEEMERFIANHDYQSLWLQTYNHYSVEAGIIDFAKDVDADLIGIANHGRTDITSLFIESIPENLVKYSDFPVLSIRV